MLIRPQTVFLAAINLIPTTLLISASSPHTRNYYLLLRLSVCIVAGINLYVLRPNWLVFALLGVIIVLFNPIAPFIFAKATWARIDLITAACFVILSIAVIEVPGRLVGGVLLIGTSALIILLGADSLVSAVRLSGGQQVNGRVIKVTTREIDAPEASGNGGGQIYESTYQFTASSGEVFTGSADYGAEIGDAVTIIYNPKNPNENRLASDTATTIYGASVRLVIMLVIAACVGGFGVEKISEEWKAARRGVS